MKLNLRTNSLPAADSRGRTSLQLAQIRNAGSFDVVVVGGGTAGAPAAIVAAQEGLKTAVIEPQSFLGGIGTGGGIHCYYFGLQTGIQIEMDKRMEAWTERIGGKASGFHPEAKKLALQEMADAAGVRCFYRSFFVAAVMDSGRICGIVAEDSAGLFWLEAQVVIDCSGDADVASAAGAPFSFGREGDHAPQPYSYAPGKIKDGQSVSFCNFDAGYVDPTHALDQSRAHFESRAHLYRERYDNDNRMIYIAPIFGLRESRFIDAEYVLTLEDQQHERRFPDVIARAQAHYDNHAQDYENESLEAQLWVGARASWRAVLCHDVPYRSLLPKQVENLLVACRACGMTHDAHNLFRMQRDMQAIGEAAAVAAAQAIRARTTVRKVDVKSVQQRLLERNALTAEALQGSATKPTSTEKSELAKMSVSALLKTFGSRQEGAAINEMLQRGSAIHAELRAALKDSDPNARLLAATVLALQAHCDGVDVLKQTLQARRADKCDAHKSQPRWLIALFLLDKLGLQRTGSLQLVSDLLKDAPLDLHRAVAAIRALGRSGSAEVVAPIRAALRRSDIDSLLTLQHSQGDKSRPTRSDRRFEIELAAASVLGKFGYEAEAVELAERHSGDERALVRHYARKVLAGIREPVAGR